MEKKLSEEEWRIAFAKREIVRMEELKDKKGRCREDRSRRQTSDSKVGVEKKEHRGPWTKTWRQQLKKHHLPLAAGVFLQDS